MYSDRNNNNRNPTPQCSRATSNKNIDTKYPLHVLGNIVQLSYKTAVLIGHCVENTEFWTKKTLFKIYKIKINQHEVNTFFPMLFDLRFLYNV